MLKGSVHIESGVFTECSSVVDDSHESAVDRIANLAAQAARLAAVARTSGAGFNRAGLYAAGAWALVDKFMQSTGGKPTEREAALFLLGLQCGRALELLDVLPHERDAFRGKVVIGAAATGGRTTAKLSPEERESARAQRDDLMELGHTKQSASKVVAKEYGVSYKTIQRL